MYFHVKSPGKKSTRDRTLKELLKSPAIMASGISTLFHQKSIMNFVIY